MEGNIISLPLQIYQLKEPIPQEAISEAKSLLKSVELPPESAKFLTNLDMRAAREFKRQKEECVRCDGSRNKCKKVIVKFDEDGKLVFSYTDCQKALDFQTGQQARDFIKRARIPKIFAQKRARDFDISNPFNEPAIDLAESAILDNKSVYIHGHCGAGKTLLACIIANERAYFGKTSFFANVPDILEDLRDTSPDKGEDRFTLTKKMKDTACLIVDDLGAEKPSDWTCETLFRIFNHRYNNESQTIITSNFSIAELQKRLNFIAGERIVRRIRDTCIEIELRR